MSFPQRKYVPLQHSVYLAGWKDCLHEVADMPDKRVDHTEDNETSRAYVHLDDLEEELGKLVPR